MSAKQKILSALQQTSGYNTFTTRQAQRRFGVQNVGARIHELRNEGYCIYSNPTPSGEVSYRLGTPTKSLVQAALQAGYSFVA